MFGRNKLNLLKKCLDSALEFNQERLKDTIGIYDIDPYNGVSFIKLGME